MDSIISRHQEVVCRALREYEVKMQDKMRAGKAQEACDVWKDFPATYGLANPISKFSKCSNALCRQALSRGKPAAISDRGVGMDGLL